MNTILYDEHRYGHRRMGVHFQRTLVAGVLPIAIAALLAYGKAADGPGLSAATGLALAGLMILLGARGLHSEAHLSTPARWLVERTDRWYPALLILLQNFFIAVMVLQLWFATARLGFPGTATLDILLVVLLVMAPLRRILFGSLPIYPAPHLEILVEFVRYSSAALGAIFAALLASRLMFPPGEKMTGTLPAGLVILWMAAVLINIGCLILFIDHVLRKMEPAAPDEKKDVLE